MGVATCKPALHFVADRPSSTYTHVYEEKIKHDYLVHLVLTVHEYVCVKEREEGGRKR